MELCTRLQLRTKSYEHARKSSCGKARIIKLIIPASAIDATDLAVSMLRLTSKRCDFWTCMNSVQAANHC